MKQKSREQSIEEEKKEEKKDKENKDGNKGVGNWIGISKYKMIREKRLQKKEEEGASKIEEEKKTFCAIY